MRKVENNPAARAPKSSGPMLYEPERMNATASPGSTACDRASPMRLMRRRTRKQPTRAHALLVAAAVSTIQRPSALKRAEDMRGRMGNGGREFWILDFGF